MNQNSSPQVAPDATTPAPPRVSRMGRPKPPVLLSATDRSDLERLLRASTTPQSMVLRVKIVLYCAEGLADVVVARELGVVNGTVGKWRRRFASDGIQGLYDRARPGRPKRLRGRVPSVPHHNGWQHAMPEIAGRHSTPPPTAPPERSPARVLRDLQPTRVVALPGGVGERRRAVPGRTR